MSQRAMTGDRDLEVEILALGAAPPEGVEIWTPGDAPQEGASISILGIPEVGRQMLTLKNQAKDSSFISSYRHQ